MPPYLANNPVQASFYLSFYPQTVAKDQNFDVQVTLSMNAGDLGRVRPSRLEVSLTLLSATSGRTANAYMRGPKRVVSSPTETSSSGAMTVRFDFLDLSIKEYGTYRIQARLLQRYRHNQDREVIPSIKSNRITVS